MEFERLVKFKVTSANVETLVNNSKSLFQGFTHSPGWLNSQKAHSILIAFKKCSVLFQLLRPTGGVGFYNTIHDLYCLYFLAASDARERREDTFWRLLKSECFELRVLLDASPERKDAVTSLRVCLCRYVFTENFDFEFVFLETILGFNTWKTAPS